MDRTWFNYYVCLRGNYLPAICHCLLATLFIIIVYYLLLLLFLIKNWWSDLHENVTKDVCKGKKELIKCWKSFTPGSRMFLKDSSTLRDRTLLHNLSHISGKILWKFHVNFVSHPDQDFDSASRPHSHWCGLLSPLIVNLMIYLSHTHTSLTLLVDPGEIFHCKPIIGNRPT